MSCPLVAAVVTQVVEEWLSVQAGRVQILGRTLAFSDQIYSSWALGFFYQLGHRPENERYFNSSFLFPILIENCDTIIIVPMHQEKKRKSKRGWERPIFLKKCLVLLILA